MTIYAPAIFILLITSLYYIPISAQGVSTSAPTTDNSAGLLYLLIFVSVIVVLYKLTHRKRKRRAFASGVRRKTLEKQHYKCANCKRPLKPRKTDYDHKNGNRSDNRHKNWKEIERARSSGIKPLRFQETLKVKNKALYEMLR